MSEEAAASTTAAPAAAVAGEAAPGRKRKGGLNLGFLNFNKTAMADFSKDISLDIIKVDEEEETDLARKFSRKNSKFVIDGVASTMELDKQAKGVHKSKEEEDEPASKKAAFDNTIVLSDDEDETAAEKKKTEIEMRKRALKQNLQQVDQRFNDIDRLKRELLEDHDAPAPVDDDVAVVAEPPRREILAPSLPEVVVIPVKCSKGLKKFKLQRDQEFSVIRDAMAQLEGVDVNWIQLKYKRDYLLDYSLTPETIGWVPIDVDPESKLVVDIVDPEELMPKNDAAKSAAKHDSEPEEEDYDRSTVYTIRVRIEHKDISKEQIYTLREKSTFKAMFAKFADLIGKSVTNLKFKFDGDTIKEDQTPDDVDMDLGDEFTVDAYLI